MLVAVTLLAAVLVAPGAAQASDGLVPCCDTTTCQLVEAINCNHPEMGTSCDGVACSGCCQGLAGNPNGCGSEFGKVACLQGNGNFLCLR